MESYRTHIIKVIKTRSIREKRKNVDTVEKFYIYRETKNGNQINDKITLQSNAIFETIVKHYPSEGSTYR